MTNHSYKLLKQYTLTATIINIILFWCCLAFADVDMSIIAKIESSNNPLAYNKSSNARGLYQFREIAWRDVQQHYPDLKKYSYLSYVYNPKISTLFLKRYFLILQNYLKYYKKPITIKNLLWAYNEGIKAIINNVMFKETQCYIDKYILLDK